MSVVIVTGSAGLVGSETVRFFCEKKYDVIGIDNNMRRTFFGEDACTDWNKKDLQTRFKNYTHYDVDIRDGDGMDLLLKDYGRDVCLIVHAAAQPSHDWAASDPFADFSVNAVGTLVMLETFRRHCPEAVFIFTSTNKVYGDRPNHLPLVELETRFELDPTHKWFAGIDETMPIDQTLHSLFGASKVAADVLVQEYGRYFGLKTASFRGGCLTGPAHSGTRLHGFLSYLMRCCLSGRKYVVYGYKGKQVRDNIHSSDLVNAFYHFLQNPRCGEVYNIGGSRHSHCSMLEAIEICQEVSGHRLDYEYTDQNRIGDHVWWISDVGRFREHYPEWSYQYDIKTILTEIRDAQKAVV